MKKKKVKKMGFLKLVFWSLFGPFLIWLALVGHVVYQVRETVIMTSQTNLLATLTYLVFSYPMV